MDPLHSFGTSLRSATVAILGFGMEGQSTLRALRPFLPDIRLMVCDGNDDLALKYPEAESQESGHDHLIEWHLGANYLENVHEADIIIKSPGIPFRELENKRIVGEITSQTELFVRLYRQQIIGITGTKGKSTTASLLYHILKEAGKDTLLVGNIGVPPFDLIGDITENTSIVFEMSSHQLEHIKSSPAKAILLNIYQEHLDHYPSYAHYRDAKLQIARWQHPGDCFIYNPEIAQIEEAIAQMKATSCLIKLNAATEGSSCVYFDQNDMTFIQAGGDAKKTTIRDLLIGYPLPGRHNLYNLGAASVAALLEGVSPKAIKSAIESFNGLPHRLEFVAEVRGVRYYNDSISTIPESAMAAIEAFPQTSTIILGGYDRGVDYSGLIRFLAQSNVQNLVFTGEAGRRMLSLAIAGGMDKQKKCLFGAEFKEAFSLAVAACLPGEICMLSPAASSYDAFSNFRERGDTFRQLVADLGFKTSGN